MKITSAPIVCVIICWGIRLGFGLWGGRLVSFERLLKATQWNNVNFCDFPLFILPPRLPLFPLVTFPISVAPPRALHCCSLSCYMAHVEALVCQYRDSQNCNLEQIKHFLWHLTFKCKVTTMVFVFVYVANIFFSYLKCHLYVYRSTGQQPVLNYV